jgi:serine/threonine protein phosphatase PrpC
MVPWDHGPTHPGACGHRANFRESVMADFVVHVGGTSAQGKRPNNEDRYVADPQRHVFLVADGMGGQEAGERASGLAAEIIPRVVSDRLAANENADSVVKLALDAAHKAIMQAGQTQAPGRKMGTTAVLAVQQDDHVFVAGLGDSRAYLIRNGNVEQLTVDHTIADALCRNGAITLDQARTSPWRNVLYKFLGCAEMTDGVDVIPFVPQAGDRLVLASDGLTNFVTADDLITGAKEHPDPQEWAGVLVDLALGRDSKDNVTCVVVAFDAE